MAATVAPLELRGERSRMPGVSGLAGLLRFSRHKPVAALGLLLIVLVALTAIFGSVITPYDPNLTHPAAKWAGPGGAHLLGADHLGRDIFSRIIAGARVSMLVGFGTTLVACSLACLIGITSGLRRGRVDFVVQRGVDIALAFPPLVLLASLSTSFPQADARLNLLFFTLPGAWERAFLVALTLGCISCFAISRVVRGAVMTMMSQQYVEAARALGVTDRRLVLLYVLPNIAPIVMVLATVTIGAAILAESTLAFLGLGLPPTIPSWGRMLDEARPGMFRLWNPSIWPGLAIGIVVWSFNMLGDGLRDWWDPRLRGRGGAR
jgi:peptide/nickel transport system permease protein